MKTVHGGKKSAWFWLIGAGFCGILITFSLILVDDALSRSKHEKLLGEKLSELRAAQASQYSRATDERQFLPFAHVGENRER